MNEPKRMLEYQKHKKYFAQVAGTLEKVATAELTELGAEVFREVPRGLYFAADDATLYRILYQSRIIQRLLAPLISFPAHSEKYLYDQATRNIDWTALFGISETFGIESNVSDSAITHSLYAGQILKDAICDSFRKAFDKRPDFDPKSPDILFNLHIHRNQATISLDLGGGSLHKRGYRVAKGEAPLQETLAAGIIRLTGWDGETPLLDPMCGSGTLLAEALMKYCRIPAGKFRLHKAIRHLPDFDPELWESIVADANAKQRPLPPGLIYGSDISAEMIRIARQNLLNLPYGASIQLEQSDIADLTLKEATMIVTNPPYGVRIGTDKTTAPLYNKIGAWLRTNCKGSTAYILCGSDELSGELRLRHRWKKTIKNADLESCLLKILLR